jgi:hypothetical protein
VEPNPVAIADAIKELYEDKQKMIKFGENARIDVERSLDWIEWLMNL